MNMRIIKIKQILMIITKKKNSYVWNYKNMKKRARVWGFFKVKNRPQNHAVREDAASRLPNPNSQPVKAGRGR